LKQNSKIRIKDIAELASVSPGTVDRVLHNRGEVKEETRIKVLKIIEDLGYTPNILAKSLASKKVYKIFVLIPDGSDENPYWQKPLKGIDMAREELGHFSTDVITLTYTIDDTSDFKRKFSEVLSKNPDGVIFTPHFVESSKEYLNTCKERNIPVLFLDSNLENEKVLGYFGQDAISSGKLAASLMKYSLKEDCSVVVLKLTKNQATSFHLIKREKGFLDAIAENNKFQIETISYEINLSKENELFTTIKKIISEHKNVKGVFVTNSRVHKAAEVLKQLGKRDLLLIGYDLVQQNINFLNEGVINFLICQKPEDQGYRSVLALFNYVLSQKKVERVNFSPIDIITKENLSFYLKI
jgi:LacI family transcriptional regulator